MPPTESESFRERTDKTQFLDRSMSPAVLTYKTERVLYIHIVYGVSKLDLIFFIT